MFLTGCRLPILFIPGCWTASPALSVAHQKGYLGQPQYVVRYHPAIRKVYVIFELDCDHFRVNLHYDPFEPISHPFTVAFVVAVNIDMIAYSKGFVPVGS
jgi:hypothetical protein